jgi:hypothetical protein
MFVGHFAVAFAAKRITPRASLALLVVAAQLADIIWPVLVALGVETVRIDPGNTAFTALDFVSYPYSHSLVVLALWGVILGMASRRAVHHRAAVAIIVALVLSHWLLDWITHRPDMPLYPGGPLTGLGLWNSIPATLAIELTMFTAGIWIYTRETRARDAAGRWGVAALVVLLLVIYLSGLFGTPPSIAAIYTATLAGSVLVGVWTWWIDRHREQVRTTA